MNSFDTNIKTLFLLRLIYTYIHIDSHKYKTFPPILNALFFNIKNIMKNPKRITVEINSFLMVNP